MSTSAPRGLWAPARPGRSRIRSEEIARRQEALSKAPLFADLSKRQLRSVADVTAIPSFEAGTTIVKEGSIESVFFVILEGKAKVTRANKSLGLLGPGDYFGEISLLDPGPRTASVVAEERTICLSLPGGDFRDILAKEPALSLKIMRELARRVRNTHTSVAPA